MRKWEPFSLSGRHALSGNLACVTGWAVEFSTGELFSAELVRAGDVCISCGATSTFGEPGIGFWTATKTDRLDQAPFPRVANSRKKAYVPRLAIMSTKRLKF